MAEQELIEIVLVVWGVSVGLLAGYVRWGEKTPAYYAFLEGLSMPIELILRLFGKRRK